MTRAVSNYTESSVDEAVLLNQELAKRQREYRIMENEKKQVKHLKLYRKHWNYGEKLKVRCSF